MRRVRSAAEEKLFPKRFDDAVSIEKRLEDMGTELEHPLPLEVVQLRYLLDVDHEGYDCVVLYAIVADHAKDQRTVPTMRAVEDAIDRASYHARIFERIYVRFRTESEQMELDRSGRYETPAMVQSWTDRSKQVHRAAKPAAKKNRARPSRSM